MESTVCLMDVGWVKDKLPAAVKVNFIEHVGFAAVLILMLLATPFSENSTWSTCLI